jgi:hypothetical protein
LATGFSEPGHNPGSTAPHCLAQIPAIDGPRAAAGADQEGTRMSNQGWRQGTLRFLRDFGLAFALFWAVAYTSNSTHGRAHAVSAYDTWVIHRNLGDDARIWGPPSEAQFRVTREARAAHTRAMLLLGFGIAGLAALNLAFLRHLRRVYASPRRGVWRRD